MSAPGPTTLPRGLAVWLVAAGAVGWWAAFALLLERLRLLEDPTAVPSCDLSYLVQCGANLQSWQGSVLGFPNPLLGVTGWVAPIVVGMALLAGARFARWFWWLFALGLTAALAFVVWLIGQSIFELHTLCPWCLVTWAVLIPTYYVVVLHVLRTGIVPSPRGVRRAAGSLMKWVPLLTILSYAVIATIAQLRLDWMATLI